MSGNLAGVGAVVASSKVVYAAGITSPNPSCGSPLWKFPILLEKSVSSLLLPVVEMLERRQEKVPAPHSSGSSDGKGSGKMSDGLIGRGCWSTVWPDAVDIAIKSIFMSRLGCPAAPVESA
jgi:hypothetical protein